MTTSAALHNFFSSFGIPAYPADAVPDNAEMPYIVYENAKAFFEDGEVAIGVSIYYHTTSETAVNAKADEIGSALRRGGKVLRCDGGSIWVKRGLPFSQILDSGSVGTKRRYINLTLEYFI